MDKLRKGWEQHLLGELFEFKNGLNTDKSKYGAGCKFVNVMDVFNNDYLIEDKIIGSVQITEKQLFEYKLKYGDVLFNRTSEVPEEIAYSTVYLDNKDAVFGGFVIRARAITDKLNEKFLIYLFQSDKFRTQVIKCGQGAIRANIGQKDLAKIKMEIPPLPEQIKIAEILSTWDNAIQTTEKQIANSQQQKKALMQMLLSGEKRVGGFSGKWGTVTLSQIANIKKGKALSSKDIIDGVYPVIAGGKTSPYNHNAYTDENVVTVSASGAYAGFVSYHPYKIWASDCSVISAKKCSDILFIFQILLYFQEKIYSLQSGGAQPHIYPKDLDSLKLEIPQEIDEQQKIAKILTTADQEIETLQKKLECLKLEKRALMQGLL